ncbi:MAG: hypothetical protein V4566_05260 [Pseudomonadota bacterium]|nr:hypothetical protein [Rhodanobacter sp. OK091]
MAITINALPRHWSMQVFPCDLQELLNAIVIGQIRFSRRLTDILVSLMHG